jgi:adenosylmethionine-8-amino-7-oxononanoate aminotransferase
VRGDGIHLFDDMGRRYVDASGGAAVSCLGHNHRGVIDAIRKQLDQIAFAHSSFFTTEPMEDLAADLVADAPAELTKVMFTSGGSESVEASLKLARQYFIEIGQRERRHVISRRQSYHGNTLGALAAGGNAWRREPFEPFLANNVRHISPCYAYRGQADGESRQAYGLRVADELEEEILSLGAETVAAFIAEPVVGATLGAVPATDGYFRRIREICNRYGVLLILDEVMCGMGRTGYRFACEADEIAPDIMAVAKGLGAGYQPIGAVLIAGRIYEAVRAGSGALLHGHTYMGHATACAGALAVQRIVREDRLLANVQSIGAYLAQQLDRKLGQHPHVGDIRGRGLFQGVELVADRDTKAPFDAGLKMHGRVKAAAMEVGLMCYPMGGTIDGRRGDHVLLAPPFIAGESDIDEIVALLAAAIEKAVSLARPSTAATFQRVPT